MARGGFAESDHVGLLDVRQLGEGCAGICGVPQPIFTSGLVASCEPNIALYTRNCLKVEITLGRKSCRCGLGECGATISTNIEAACRPSVKFI
ncbi:hypothetical protein D3C77_661620 [compost metagenome]